MERKYTKLHLDGEVHFNSSVFLPAILRPVIRDGPLLAVHSHIDDGGINSKLFHNREGISEKLAIGPKEIVLIDSLHGMFEDMTGSIPEEKKFKLYIETLSQIKNREGRFVRWADIRMLRRMVRDMQFRNYRPEQTIAHWHYVRRSELRYIISRLQNAHSIVNSFLPYELPIMKHRLGNLIPEFIRQYGGDPDRKDGLSRARRVEEIFSEIPGWTDESMVPSTSLLREFIGGSRYSY